MIWLLVASHRFVEPEHDPSVLDILWSDPALDADLLSLGDDDYRAFMQTEWKPNAKRGCSYVFGYKVIKEFLEKVSVWGADLDCVHVLMY